MTRAGIDFSFVNSWFGSSLNSNGFVFASTFKGESTISNSRIAGNFQSGVLINGGVQIALIGNQIVQNSNQGLNLFAAVTVAANVTDFIIQGNFLGGDAGIGSLQSHGAIVSTGTSDFYVIQNNICHAQNVGTCVSDGGSGVNKVVTPNF